MDRFDYFRFWFAYGTRVYYRSRAFVFKLCNQFYESILGNTRSRSRPFVGGGGERYCYSRVRYDAADVID
jgi:hypothetical protein